MLMTTNSIDAKPSFAYLSPKLVPFLGWEFHNLSRLFCKGNRWQIIQWAVWSNVVVLILPLDNFQLCFLHSSKPVTVQTFISKLTVEALYKCILGGLSWLDKSQLHTRFSAPKEHCLAGKLGAIVTDDFSGLVATFKLLTQKSRNLGACDRHRDQLPHHLAWKVINHIQHSKPSAIAELVWNEVHRPALIHSRGCVTSAHMAPPSPVC